MSNSLRLSYNLKRTTRLTSSRTHCTYSFSQHDAADNTDNNAPALPEEQINNSTYYTQKPTGTQCVTRTASRALRSWYLHVADLPLSRLRPGDKVCIKPRRLAEGGRREGVNVASVNKGPGGKSHR